MGNKYSIINQEKISEILITHKQKIDAKLEEFFHNKISEAGLISLSGRESIEQIRSFTMRGGKRIRPLLVILGYKACGGKNDKAIADAALAVELMESFLLIHDDIIDQDAFRRGGPAMHKAFESKFEGHKTEAAKTVAAHYGISAAIICGDIVSIMGSEALISSDFPLREKLKAVEKFNKVVTSTCYGQMLDLDSEAEQDIRKISAEDVLAIHKMKTAVYTAEGPLHIGALLAGAGEKQLKALSDYAIPLGIAFQIQDDILGMFGDEKKTGKPVGSDLNEGKKTLLILKALEKAGKKERCIILGCLGNRQTSLEQIEDIRKIIVSTGSLEYSKSLAAKFAAECKEAIQKQGLDKDTTSVLAGLADYIVNREK
jgi:geranylgeranyl diphosphate synthase, type I